MILVTGANGLVGRALVKKFIIEGERVRAQVRDREKLLRALSWARTVEGESAMPATMVDLVEPVSFDLSQSDPQSYIDLVRGCTAVVHAGGIVHRPEASKQEYAIENVRATRLLAESAAAAKVNTFVFFSSSSVYGDGPFASVAESLTLNPQTPYALSKLNCEETLSRTIGVPRLIMLRPSLVFGEGDRGNMRSLIAQIGRGMYFHIKDNNARKSVIYSEDLAAAVRACMSRLSDGRYVFNVGNAQPVGIIDLANTIAALSNKPAPPTVGAGLVRLAANAAQALLGPRAPLTLERMEKLMTTTTVDVGALKSATGFVPATTLESALSREIRWLTAQIKLGDLIS